MMFTPEWFRSCREERTAKVGGWKWRMHQNDADKWPSDPHAHDGGYKLDLSNGDVYLAATRKCVDKISRKEMAKVRRQLKLPPI